MVEIIEKLSLIAFIAAGVCALLAIFLWFHFRILSVVNDLSGKTAKKAIAKIRKKNTKTGDKSYRSSIVNIKRGPLTNAIEQGKNGKTEKLYAGQAEAKLSETTLLQDAAKTEVLLNRENTTVLQNNSESIAPPKSREEVELIILEQIVLIHTNEVIP